MNPFSYLPEGGDTGESSAWEGCDDDDVLAVHLSALEMLGRKGVEIGHLFGECAGLGQVLLGVNPVACMSVPVADFSLGGLLDGGGVSDLFVWIFVV